MEKVKSIHELPKGYMMEVAEETLEGLVALIVKEMIDKEQLEGAIDEAIEMTIGSPDDGANVYSEHLFGILRRDYFNKENAEKALNKIFED